MGVLKIFPASSPSANASIHINFVTAASSVMQRASNTLPHARSLRPTAYLSSELPSCSAWVESTAVLPTPTNFARRVKKASF